MEQPKHLFISYSHTDRAWVERLAHELRVAGHRIWTDRVSIRVGDDWKRALQTGIAEADAVVLCWSSAAAASSYVAQEIDWANERGIPILPALIEYVPLPLSLTHNEQYIDFSERPYDEARQLLVNSLPVPRDIERIPFLVDWPRIELEGRDTDLEEIYSLLTRAGYTVGIAPAAISGMGGIGKTQLAVEYAWRYRYFYEGGVYWVNAAEDWASEFVRLADRLSLTPADAEAPDRTLQMVAAFERYIKQRPNSLLILDNVEHPSLIASRAIGLGIRVTSLGVHVLFTTRRRETARGIFSHSLGVLSLESAKRLICRGRPDLELDPLIEEVCSALGYLPLAVESAATFLERHSRMTADAYLKETRRRSVRLSESGSSNKLDIYYATNLYPALATQWSGLKDANSEQVMKVAAGFGEAALIPAARLGLLIGLVGSDAKSWSNLDGAVQDLNEAALIEVLSDGIVRLHPLVREYVRRTFGEAEIRSMMKRCAAQLVSSLQDPYELRWQTCARGIDALLDDMREVTVALGEDQTKDLVSLRRLLEWESHQLRTWDCDGDPGHLWQQIRERAHHESEMQRCAAIDAAFTHEGLSYFRSMPWSRYPTDPCLIRVLQGHKNWVVDVVRQGLVRGISVSDDNTICFWDLERGEILSQIGSRGATVLRLLKDGRLLTGSVDHTIRIWDTEQGVVVAEFAGHKDTITSLMELEDGTIVSGSADHTACVWQEGRNHPLRVLREHTQPVKALARLSDGRIATGSMDGTVRIWNPGSDRSARTLQSNAAVTCMSASGSQLLAGCLDGTARVWDTSNRFHMSSLIGHQEAVTCSVWLDQFHVVTGSADRTLRLWDARSVNTLHVFEGHADGVTCVALVSGDAILSGSADSTLRLWSTRSRPQAQGQVKLQRHEARVTSVAWLAPSRAVTASRDAMLYQWDTDDGTVVGHVDTLRVPINCVARSGSDRVLVGGEDGSIVLWDTKTETRLATLPGHSGPITAVASVPSGGLAVSGSHDATVRVWDLTLYQQRQRLDEHSDSVTCISCLSDDLVATGSADRSVIVWNVSSPSTNHVVHRLLGHREMVVGIAVVQNRLVSVSRDGDIYLWDIATGNAISKWTIGAGTVNCMVAVNEHQLVLGVDDATLLLWDVDTGQCTARLHLDAAPTSLDALDHALLVGDYVGRLNGYTLELLR